MTLAFEEPVELLGVDQPVELLGVDPVGSFDAPMFVKPLAELLPVVVPLSWCGRLA
jgi:hypothetical protein